MQSFIGGLAKYSLHLFVERKIKQFIEEASTGLATLHQFPGVHH